MHINEKPIPLPGISILVVTEAPRITMARPRGSTIRLAHNEQAEDVTGSLAGMEFGRGARSVLPYGTDDHSPAWAAGQHGRGGLRMARHMAEDAVTIARQSRGKRPAIRCLCLL